MDIVTLIVIGVLSRLAPHLPNVTVVGGLAIFSGSRYSKTKALGITVAAMVITDAILGFHSVMLATYGSLACSVLLANYFLKKRSSGRIISVTLISSIIFYLVTNFAVWAITGSMYPKTFAGLMDSYIMALPFFRNSLIGDFIYTSVFFGGLEVIGNIFKEKVYGWVRME